MGFEPGTPHKNQDNDNDENDYNNGDDNNDIDNDCDTTAYD